MYEMNNDVKVIAQTETTTVIDAEGNETTTIKETTNKISRVVEPDYIKIYTKMWCEFNGIPSMYRELFLQLAIRMSYCNLSNLGRSQVVNTGKPWCDDIMDVLGWKRRMYQKGLSVLCECGAIKKLANGVYQINPSYAGKGEWRYNPKLNRGGIEDLVATFNFRDKTVDTDIVWADDGTNSDINNIYRDGLMVDPEEETVLKTIDKKVNKDESETSEKCDDTV